MRTSSNSLKIASMVMMSSETSVLLMAGLVRPTMRTLPSARQKSRSCLNPGREEVIRTKKVGQDGRRMDSGGAT